MDISSVLYPLLWPSILWTVTNFCSAKCHSNNHFFHPDIVLHSLKKGFTSLGACTSRECEMEFYRVWQWVMTHHSATFERAFSFVYPYRSSLIFNENKFQPVFWTAGRSQNLKEHECDLVGAMESGIHMNDLSVSLQKKKMDKHIEGMGKVEFLETWKFLKIINLYSYNLENMLDEEMQGDLIDLWKNH